MLNVKFFPFIDAGFSRESMSAACVKSSPDTNSLFFKINHNKITFRPSFASNFYVKKTLQKTTPAKSLHLPQMNLQINKSTLATAKVSRILSCNVYACK